MLIAQLKSQIANNSLNPTIFSYADANHYLVGAEDSDGNFFSLSDKNEKTIVFNSMYEASTCLKSIGCKKVNLHLQTAYDEMVGNDISSDTQIMLDVS
jgi:hypothetical protein